MKELVRCRPCGFVMEADKLGDVCPACGLPRKVFEPYREKVSRNRLMLLNLDLHPIVIHLSQAFVIAIPLLVIMKSLFSSFQPEMIKNVLLFSVFVFPFTLVMAIITGIIDGLTRFKTLATPLLRVKIIFSFIILTLSVIIFFVAPNEKNYTTDDHLKYIKPGCRCPTWTMGQKTYKCNIAGDISTKERQ